MPEWGDLTVTVTTILQLIGTFGVISGGIAGVVALVHKFSKPHQTLKEKVDRHDELLGRDKVRLDEIESGNQLILRSLMSLIEHEINGNSVDKLKKIKEDIHDYLIKK